MEERNIRDSFDRLEGAAIDACSIIYLLKTGVFERLASEIKLMATEEVYAETGWPLDGDKPRLPLSLFPSDRKARSNDHGIFLLARGRKIPLISDDGDVLGLAEKEGMAYYNSLMMLLFLRYRNRVGEKDYPLYRERLLSVARYGEAIMARADAYGALLF